MKVELDGFRTTDLVQGEPKGSSPGRGDDRPPRLVAPNIGPLLENARAILERPHWYRSRVPEARWHRIFVCPPRTDLGDSHSGGRDPGSFARIVLAPDRKSVV